MRKSSLMCGCAGWTVVFSYRIPEQYRHQLRPGHQVLVPFNNRLVIGYVVALTEEAEVPNVKAIHRICGKDPVLKPEMLALARWMAEYYGACLWMPCNASSRRECGGSISLDSSLCEGLPTKHTRGQAPESDHPAEGARQREVLTILPRHAFHLPVEGLVPCEKVTLVALTRQGLSP